MNKHNDNQRLRIIAAYQLMVVLIALPRTCIQTNIRVRDDGSDNHQQSSVLGDHAASNRHLLYQSDVSATTYHHVVCKPGKGGRKCQPCEVGYFSAGGKNVHCKKCPAGFTTTGRGSSSCTVCLPGCGGSKCAQCAVGSWSDGGLPSFHSCSKCPTGYTTKSAGATAKTDCNICLPGFGGKSCARCGMGYWSSGGKASSTVCTKCPSGYTTKHLGSTKKSDCVRGRRLCSGVTCNSPGVCQSKGVCDPDTGKCKYGMAVDGTPCPGGTCAKGVCKAGPSCSATDCKMLAVECQLNGTCNPLTALCSFTPAADGSACLGGTCQGGLCKSLGVSLIDAGGSAAQVQEESASKVVLKLPSNVSPSTFNPAGTAFIIAADPPSLDLATVKVFVDGNELNSTAITPTSASLTFTAGLTAGTHTLLVTAKDSQNNLVFQQFPDLTFGSRAVKVTVLNPDGQAAQNASVSVTLGRDQSVISSGTTHSNGTVTFQNLPSDTTILSALSPNLDTAVVMLASQTEITVKLTQFLPPSAVDNNDFSNGTSGWVCSHNSCFVSPHAVDAPVNSTTNTTNGGRRRELLDQDMDMWLKTSGTGEQTMSRSFTVPVGTAAINVVFKFVTKEFPTYYGSKYDDAFSITIKSKLLNGVVARYASSLNAFSKSYYTQTSAGGATPWMVLQGAISPGGDTVQIDVAVANVGDGVLDSMVVLDVVKQSSLKISKVQLTDMIGQPLKFLSASPHSYFNGNTRVHGTITIVGADTDKLASLTLEVIDNSKVVATGSPPPSLQSSLFKEFGSGKTISVTVTQHLFDVASAQFSTVSQDTEATLLLRVKATTTSGETTSNDCGSVIKLVRYTGSNRFGVRDTAGGGDDWARPTTVNLAKAVGDSFQWNDFSRMNGGQFPPHNAHRLGISIDGLFAGYTARTAGVASQMIDQLNSLGKVISQVFVTFTPAYKTAIQGKTLKDGRAATSVITDYPKHADHFHWEIQPQQPVPSLPPLPTCNDPCTAPDALLGSCAPVPDGSSCKNTVGTAGICFKGVCLTESGCGTSTATPDVCPVIDPSSSDIAAKGDWRTVASGSNLKVFDKPNCAGWPTAKQINSLAGCSEFFYIGYGKVTCPEPNNAATSYIYVPALLSNQIVWVQFTGTEIHTRSCAGGDRWVTKNAYTASLDVFAAPCSTSTKYTPVKQCEKFTYRGYGAVDGNCNGVAESPSYKYVRIEQDGQSRYLRFKSGTDLATSACPAPACTGLPPAAEGVTWPSTCSSLPNGFSCSAACKTGYSGGPVTADCTAGTWSAVKGKCTKAGDLPETYAPCLTALGAAHPAWTYELVQYSMTQAEVVDKNLNNRKNPLGLPKSDLSKFKETDQSIVMAKCQWHTQCKATPKTCLNYSTCRDLKCCVATEGPEFYLANQQGVEYFTSITHFLNDEKVGCGHNDGDANNDYGIFQFMVLSFDTAGSADVLKTMMTGSFFEHLASKDSLDEVAKMFMEAGKQYNVNQYYLVATALGESTSGGLSTGYKTTCKGKQVTLYNFFSYGFSDNNFQGGVNTACSLDWTSPAKCISGFAAKVGAGYINKGQDTYFLQRWDVVHWPDISHQYATNIGFAELNARLLAKARVHLFKQPLKFKIPVWKA